MAHRGILSLTKFPWVIWDLILNVEMAERGIGRRRSRVRSFVANVGERLDANPPIIRYNDNPNQNANWKAYQRN